MPTAIQPSSHQVLIDAVELERLQELANRSRRYRAEFWHLFLTCLALAAVSIVYAVIVEAHALLLLVAIVALIAMLIP